MVPDVVVERVAVRQHAELEEHRHLEDAVRDRVTEGVAVVVVVAHAGEVQLEGEEQQHRERDPTGIVDRGEDRELRERDGEDRRVTGMTSMGSRKTAASAAGRASRRVIEEYGGTAPDD